MDSWFHLPRRPEPELMDSEEEVEAYSSAAAQKYLAKIDRSFVGHVEKLFRGASVAGTALDLGCGPGQIPIMMAGRWPALRITGLDASPRMIEQARRNASHASVPIAFQVFRFSKQSTLKTGSGRLPFADRCFDLVTCNSVLHHLSDPLAALDEIARVARPSAAILIRDLRRPSAPALQLHLAFFGRHYSGEMCRLYRDSVRAAYTVSELNELLEKSALNSTGIRPPKVFHHGFTHIGIARPFRAE